MTAEPRPWPAFTVPDPLPADGTVLHTQDGWQWAVRSGAIACEPVPAGVVDVEDRIIAQLRTAIGQLEQAHTDWPTLTNAQKDAVLRGLVRAVGRLCRLAVRNLESEGE